MPRHLTVILVLALAWLAGCGNGTTTEPDPDPERVIAALSIEPATVTLGDGGTATVQATVTDQHGQPFQTLPAGATLAWDVSDPAVIGLTVSPGALAAEITGLVPGTAAVQASLQSLAAQSAVIVTQVATQVTLVAGAGQEAAVGEALGEPIVFAATDRHGAPVPDVEVAFEVTGGGGTLSAASAQTDPDGLASVEWTLGDEPGEQTLEASVADVPPAQASAFATEIAAAGTVSGVVLAGDGQTPIQGATVTLLAENAAPAPNPGIAAADVLPQTTTDAEGRFVLEDVPAGEQTLIARSGVFSATFQVNVLPGQTSEVGTVELEAEGAMAYVAGDFDAMEDVLAHYQIDAVELDVMDLADPEIVSEYVMIFINCGADLEFVVEDLSAIVENLRSYVNEGGLLYVSDLEAPLIRAMFPEQVQALGYGDEQTVAASVVDDSLSAFLAGQSSVVIEYNFDDWATLAALGDGPTVLIQGSYTGDPDGQDAPLAIFIDEGEGRVIHTTFHNNAQATDDQWAVLRYFLYRTGHFTATGMAPIRLGPSHAPMGGAPSAELAEQHRRYAERSRERMGLSGAAPGGTRP